MAPGRPILMKKLLLLAALALASPRAFAQQAEPHAQPTDNDDTIVLTLPDEGLAAWGRAGRLLAHRGYPIRYASPELLTLTTEPIFRRGTGTVGIVLLVEGHELRLQAYGLISSEGSPAAEFRMTDRGGVLGGVARTWDELEAVARLLGGTVRYARSVNN